MKKQKNKCLYTIKAICCIAVIFMHCPFPEPYGKLLAYCLKIAIPIFFMTSGFFLYNNEKNVVEKSLPRKIKHILKLLILSELFYGVYTFLFDQSSIQFGGFCDIILKLFTGTFFNGTLWFLYALLWSYIIIIFINKKDLYKISYILAPITLVLHIIIRAIVKNASWYNAMLFRNCLFYGLPFVIIGIWIKKNQEKLSKKISNKTCIIGSIIGEVIVAIEYLITKTSLDIYIGTIISSFFVFIFSIKNPNKYFSKILEYIGEKLSMLMYILHILAINIVTDIAIWLNMSDSITFEWIKPIIVVCITIIMSYTYNIFSNKLPRRKERNA